MATRRRIPTVRTTRRAEPRRTRSVMKKAPKRSNELSGKIKPQDEESFLLNRISGHFPPDMYRNDHEFLHVSDLLRQCLRKYAIAHRTKTMIVGERVYDNQGVMYAIGHAISGYITSKAQRIVPDKLYGDWYCMCRSSHYLGTATVALEQEPCSACLGQLEHYGELNVENREIMVSGAVDVALLETRALYLTEVKSIKKDDWDTITRPIPDHILQAVFYWWLAKEKGYSLHDQCSVLYGSKGFTRGSPFKEFVIKPQQQVHRLEPYIEEAKVYKKALEGGPLPRRICKSPTDTMAKKCQLSTLCFGMD
jgi:hypothetical protein